VKFAKITAAAAAIAMIGGTAMAQDTGAYGTIGVKSIEFDAYSVEARLGYQINEFLAVEGEGAVGVISDDTNGVDVKEDFALGAFVRAGVPVSEQFKLFGRVGYSFSQYGVSGGGISLSEDFDGFAFGGGAEFSLNDASAIRADYTAVDFGDKNGVNVGTADTFSLAYVRKF
jgi:opacity protein-like surface antigen